MYNNGKYLKERYSDFIGKEFKLEVSSSWRPVQLAADACHYQEIHAQSTDVSRTKMSLQLVLAGLFTPNTTPLEWNKELDWHPIPYSYEPLDQDTLLLVRTKCPRYYEALENVFANEAAEEIKKSAPLFEQLTNITGLPIQTPEDVQSLFATLQAEVIANLTPAVFEFAALICIVTGRLWRWVARVDQRILPRQAAANDRLELHLQRVHRRDETH